MTTAPTDDTSLEGRFTPLYTAARFLADLPDDRPRVFELIEFYELLIKGQLEEYLPLHVTETIWNAVNDREGMSLLIKAFEEHPTLLHKLRKAIGKPSSKYFSYGNNFTL